MMRTSRLSKSELAVFCTVLILHFVGAIFLSKMIGREEILEAPGDSLVVHWIQRTPQSIKKPDQPAKRALLPLRITRQRTTNAIIAAKATSSLRDSKDAPSQLDLSTQAPPITFERNPLVKHEQLQATPTRMQVTIVDRSFFGTLQRMTKAQNCKELRMALSKASGDATTIMATMQKEGCIRS